MGLIKRNGYNVKGIELEEAYAKINRLYIEYGSMAKVYFGISNTRENIDEGNSLKEIQFSCYIDKNAPIYEQIYVSAKAGIFQDWEDDIVVETPAVNEPIEEEPTEEETSIDTMPVEEEIEVQAPVDTLPVQEEVVVEENTNDKYFENNEETTEETVEEREETIEEPTELERGSW